MAAMGPIKLSEVEAAQGEGTEVDGLARLIDRPIAAEHELPGSRQLYGADNRLGLAAGTCKDAEIVGAVLVELGRRSVERQRDLGTGLVARGLDRGEEQLQRFLGMAALRQGCAQFACRLHALAIGGG